MAKRKVRRKKRKQISQTNFIILLVATIAMASVSLFLFVSRPSELDKLNTSYIDSLDKDTNMKELVKESYKKRYAIQDTSYYGETLKFYQGKEHSDTDGLMGQNVLLHNVETKEEIIFTFGNGSEDGIKTGSLKPGLYEVFVYDHFVKKRVYADKVMHLTPFETMRRHKKVYHVAFDADKDYLKDYNVEMDKNYAFLSVTETIPKVETIDVLLDPCGDIYDPDQGTVVDGIDVGKWNEQKSSYAFAQKVKKELEKYGLKVALSRKEDGTPSYYGKNGRVAKGYEKNAKAFLSLGFLQDDEQIRPMIVTSAYSSGALADRISYLMGKDGIEFSDTSQDEHGQGVQIDTFIQNAKFKNTKYETYPQLRESGGKSTFTGQYENSKENQRYKDNNGMYGIYFMFCNPYSKDSTKYYKAHKDQMAKSLAKAVANYFDIEKGDKNETNN